MKTEKLIKQINQILCLNGIHQKIQIMSDYQDADHSQHFPCGFRAQFRSEQYPRAKDNIAGDYGFSGEGFASGQGLAIARAISNAVDKKQEYLKKRGHNTTIFEKSYFDSVLEKLSKLVYQFGMEDEVDGIDQIIEQEGLGLTGLGAIHNPKKSDVVQAVDRLFEKLEKREVVRQLLLIDKMAEENKLNLPALAETANQALSASW